MHNIAEFAAEMQKVVQECMRVLRPGKHCAILMGDSRRNKHFVPITPRMLMSFLEAGFILRCDKIRLCIVFTGIQYFRRWEEFG